MVLAHPHLGDFGTVLWTRGQGKFPEPGPTPVRLNFGDLRQIVHGTQGGFRSNVTCNKKKTVANFWDMIVAFTGLLTPELHASSLVPPPLHPAIPSFSAAIWLNPPFHITYTLFYSLQNPT